MRGPRYFEFDRIRGRAPSASFGLFTLRIDQVSVSALDALDDDAPPAHLARVGAPTGKTGAAGNLFSDPFESRRHVFILSE